jgi:hypothetical protein
LDSLSAEEQRLFSRMAEVYAGFLAHTDDQIGTTPVTVVPRPGAADLDAPSDRVDAVLDAGQTRALTPWLGARSRARSRAHRTPGRLPRVATDRHGGAWARMLARILDWLEAATVTATSTSGSLKPTPAAVMRTPAVPSKCRRADHPFGVMPAPEHSLMLTTTYLYEVREGKAKLEVGA